jgi:hypothetical protein
MAVRTPISGRRWRVAAALLAATTAVGLAVAVPASAGTDPSTHPPARLSTSDLARQKHADATLSSGTQSGSDVRYARIERTCGAAKAGQVSCMALRRVDVAKGSKDAIAYTKLVGAHGPKGGYSPADLAKVYKLQTGTPTDQVVAVVDAYNNPRVLHELNRFDRQYGLPAETKDSFQVVNQAGGATLPQTDWGWAVETALDVQAVRGVCNKCKILLVEADNASGTSLAAAENTAVRLGANIVSNSYGGPEQGTTQSLKLAYRHRGVVIVAATGDDGWYDWDFINTADPAGDLGTSDNMPNVPAALPSVIAVGGTSLTLTSSGKRASETVWNGDGEADATGQAALAEGASVPGASGGGCSTRYAAPVWQAKVAGYANTGCGKKRLAGDVSAVADPATGYSVYAPEVDPSSDGWQVVGGTSLATPLIAGMYGLVGGSGGVAYPGQSLYLNFKYNTGWAHDVTKGSNAFCGGLSTTDCSAAVEKATSDPGPPTGNPNNLADSNDNALGLLDCNYAANSDKLITTNTQCVAAKGYDGPSGVGTPNGARLLRSAWPSVQLGHPTRPRAHLRQTYRAKGFVDTIAHATQYAWRWDDGTSPTVTKRSWVTHKYAKPGTYRVRLTVWDSRHRKVTVELQLTVR